MVSSRNHKAAPVALATLAVVDGSDLRLAVPAGSPVSAAGLTGVSVVLKEAGA